MREKVGEFMGGQVYGLAAIDTVLLFDRYTDGLL